jgi:cell division inhibitor SulA
MGTPKMLLNAQAVIWSPKVFRFWHRGIKIAGNVIWAVERKLFRFHFCFPMLGSLSIKKKRWITYRGPQVVVTRVLIIQGGINIMSVTSSSKT